MKIDDITAEIKDTLAELEIEPKPGDLVRLAHRHLQTHDEHSIYGLLVDITYERGSMFWVVLVDGIPGVQVLNSRQWKCWKKSTVSSRT